MQRLFGSMTCLALVAMVVGGCGSTGDSIDGDDSTVLRLVRFDATGITQADGVLENSAGVDVDQNLCRTTGDMGGEPMISLEPFTETTINALFRNDQKLDIRISGYKVHVEDPDVGVGDVVYTISGNVVGGRCSNASDRSCASSQECLIGGAVGTCTFGETSINGLKLFDFDTKERVQPRVYGRGLPVLITFLGSDILGNDYKATAFYTVTFDSFCNCGEDALCTF